MLNLNIVKYRPEKPVSGHFSHSEHAKDPETVSKNVVPIMNFKQILLTPLVPTGLIQVQC